MGKHGYYVTTKEEKEAKNKEQHSDLMASYGLRKLTCLTCGSITSIMNEVDETEDKCLLCRCKETAKKDKEIEEVLKELKKLQACNFIQRGEINISSRKLLEVQNYNEFSAILQHLISVRIDWENDLKKAAKTEVENYE